MVGVRMNPGLTAFTRMLRGVNSAANTRANAATAALAPE